MQDPFPPPDGWEWEHKVEIITSGSIPDINSGRLRGQVRADRDSLEPGLLPPRGPIDRLAHFIRRRQEEVGTREERLRREWQQRLVDWGEDRPGDWPGP